MQDDTPLLIRVPVFGTVLFALLLFLLVSMYLYGFYQSYDLRIINKAYATTALILIGFSFALSGICHFFPRASHFIVYRKPLGLYGFALVVAHGVISLFFLPSLFPFPTYYVQETNMLSFLFALVATMILTMMAVISNKFSVQKLGGKLWKRLLGLGYTAYFLSIVHFSLKTYSHWFDWIPNRTIPPPELLLFCFACGVLLLRITLFFATRKKSQISPPTK